MTSLTLVQASHLARRAGFSAQQDSVGTLMLASTREEAVSALLAIPPTIIPLPEWASITSPRQLLSEVDRDTLKSLRRTWSKELKHWWFKQMVHNDSSIQEKMTLFWANHFTSSLKKVKWPQMILAQNQLLREHAIGSYKAMLKGILRNPAMLIYLDNANSKKQSPNENLARELLELFTMGEGTYSEQDVKELARALTGASVDKKTGLYQFKEGFHDTGEKTIFGQTGHFTPDDVADLILAQPEVAPFIAKKIAKFFISLEPTSEQLDKLASLFVTNDYQIAPVIEALLNSDEFWQDQGNMIKSPMELLVGSTQLFQLPEINPRRFIHISKALGQDLFDPPHVKGWSEGKAWYHTGTVMMRERINRYFVRNANIQPDLAQILAVSSVATLPDTSSRNYLSVVVNDPAYQVI